MTARTYLFCQRFLFLILVLTGFMLPISRADPPVLTPKLESAIVYVDPPRGGFGDVASNLIMAKKLTEIRPDISMQIVVSREASELVQKLVPGFDPLSHLPQSLKFGKYYMDFISPYALPKGADVALVFSTGAVHNLTAYAPLALLYREYGDIQWESDATWKAAGSGRSGVEPGGAGNSVVLNTGAQHNGFYISPEKPSVPMSKSKMENRLETVLDRPFEKGFLPSEGALIAPCYTKRKLATQLYLDAIAVAAAKPPFDKQKISVVIKNHEGLKIPDFISNNVRVYKYSTIPFDVSEALVAHADLPTMTTGDGSLSLALDYEKPFFYESNSWKNVSSEELSTSLAKHSKYFKRLGNNKKLGEVLSIDPIVGGVSPERLGAFMGDHEFNTGFVEAMAGLRKTSSLPDVVWKQAEALKQLNFSRVNHMTYETVLDAVSGAKSRNTEVFHFLRKVVANPRTSLGDRLKSVKALLAMKQWESPENLDVIIQLFTDRSASMRGRGRDFFYDGLTNDSGPFRKIFDRALSSKKVEIRNGAIETLLASGAILEKAEDPRISQKQVIRDFISSRLQKSGTHPIENMTGCPALFGELMKEISSDI